MNTIKFGHEYTKMPVTILDGSENTSILLDVFSTTTEALSKVFIEYDTKTVIGDYYKLPSGKIIILLLKSKTELWTTIRSYNFEKEKYYRSMIGQKFKIQITRTKE